MNRRREIWHPTDHACRECGGRVVMVSGHGPTGGGNPVFQCADCGIASADMGPQCICWCGFSHKGQAGTVYVCVAVERARGDPAVELALMRAGYLSENPRRRPKCEIAVVTEDSLRWAAEQVAGTAKEGTNHA
jgi:hypothetical protein